MLKESPLFIVGSPKSGTTLVRGLLNRHPDFQLDCELHPSYLFLKYHWDMLQSDLIRLDREDALSRERNEVLYEGLLLRRLAIDYFTQLHSGWEKDLRWGSSTRAIAFHYRLVRAWFPKATFILMMRDPRDVWASIRHNTWPGQAWLAKLDGFMPHYMHFLNMIEKAPGDFVVIRYEDVVEVPRTVYDRLNLEPPENYLEGLGRVYSYRTLPEPDHAQEPEDRIYDRRGRWRQDGLPEDEQAALKPLLDRCREVGYPYDDY